MPSQDCLNTQKKLIFQKTPIICVLLSSSIITDNRGIEVENEELIQLYHQLQEHECRNAHFRIRKTLRIFYKGML